MNKFTIVTIAIFCLIVGWIARGKYNEEEMKEEVRIRFIEAITYGINNSMIVVQNTNFQSALHQSL